MTYRQTADEGRHTPPSTTRRARLGDPHQVDLGSAFSRPRIAVDTIACAQCGARLGYVGHSEQAGGLVYWRLAGWARRPNGVWSLPKRFRGRRSPLNRSGGRPQYYRLPQALECWQCGVRQWADDGLAPLKANPGDLLNVWMGST